MPKKNSPERQEMLRKRRIAQRNRVPTFPRRPEGKYIPAGILKNIKEGNR